VQLVLFNYWEEGGSVAGQFLLGDAVDSQELLICIGKDGSHFLEGTVAEYYVGGDGFLLGQFETSGAEFFEEGFVPFLVLIDILIWLCIG